MTSPYTKPEEQVVGSNGSGNAPNYPPPPPPPPPQLLTIIQENERLHVDAVEARRSRAHIFETLTNESAEERQAREERENAEKNELSLVRMLVRHNQQIGVANNINVNRAALKNAEVEGGGGGAGGGGGSLCNGSGQQLPGNFIVDEDFYTRDELRRTTSMVKTGPGEVQAMSKQYKMVTSGVLWFCYFSLALNDYIFGPTFDDLSKILEVTFEKIAYFAVFRQFAYTLGSLGGVGFNYVNRQVALAVLLLLSGVTLFLAPYSPSLGMFYLIAVINGFAAGACDVGFHIFLIEMFHGGAAIIQALHFSFGLGIAIAPLITSSFLSGESECGKEGDVENKSNITKYNHFALTPEEISLKRSILFVPYAIIGATVIFGGILLGILYCYKPYIPPKERKLPISFDEQMPKQLSRMEKLELWKKSVPSFYIILVISLGSCLLFAYYGLEVTYFQFMAQFSTAVPLPISGSSSANLEAATGTSYAIGGFLAVFASFKFHPQRMIYVNFVLMNVGGVILNLSFQNSLVWFWVGNIIMGFGFSSCYATAYTFLEHQISVTNTIGSVFLFAGGLGTTLFPLLLSAICSHPEYLIYLAYFAINISMLLFVMLHFMTNIRGKQVKLIKSQLLRSPATLTQFKERTMSTLSYVSSFNETH